MINNKILASLVDSMAKKIEDDATGIAESGFVGQSLGLEGINQEGLEFSNNHVEALSDWTSGESNESFRSFLTKELNIKNGDVRDAERLDRALDMATRTIISATNVPKFVEAMKKSVQYDATAVQLGGKIRTKNIGLEAFSQSAIVPTSKYVAMSVVLAAMSAGTDAASEAFFPTHNLAAAEGGLALEISQAYIVQAKQDYVGKSTVNLHRRRLHDAHRDASLLAPRTTKIVPSTADLTGADVNLFVPVTEQPDRMDTSTGVEVPTRSLAVGKDANLLALSAVKGLVSAPDHTDMIEGVPRLESVLLKATVGTKENTFVLNLRDVAGWTFEQAGQGSQSTYVVNFNNVVALKSTVLGQADSTKPLSDLGIGAAATFSGDHYVAFKVRVSGEIDIATGTASLQQQVAPTIVSVTDGNVTKTLKEIETATPSFTSTLEVIGWNVDARRSNANMEQKGIVIEHSVAQRYLLNTETKSPFSTIAPKDHEGFDVPLASLRDAADIRKSNEFITRLLSMQDMIRGLALNTPVHGNYIQMPGLNYIKPVLVSNTVNLANIVITNRSTNAEEDLRKSIVSVVTSMVSQLVARSDFMTALKAIYHTQEFEVLVVTGTKIAQRLQLDGDSRMLGAGNIARVFPHPDSRLDNTILFTVAPVKTNANYDLSPGVRTQQPALVYKNTQTVDGKTQEHVFFQPVDEVHVLTPILGNLTVQGLDEILVTQAPVID